MLKRKRLYRDKSGQVWHIKSDGKAVKYPQFEELPEAPKGEYVEILPDANIEMSDNLYLAEATATHVLVAPSYLCIISKDTERRKQQDNAYKLFNVIDCTWQIAVTTCDYEYKLFPVANLICGHEYMIKGHKMTLDCFRKEAQGFSFIDDKDGNCDSSAFVGVHQICCVEEVQKMPKMFRIWKEENGKVQGLDCKTGREFAVSASAFEMVEVCAKEPHVGDIVYINNLSGIRPYKINFVQKVAKELNNNTLMLRYAYGYYPSLDIRDYDKKPWKVLYTGINSSLIEEHYTGERSMVCVCDNESLTVLEDQKEDAPF